MNLMEAHAYTKAYSAQIWHRAQLNDALAQRVIAISNTFIADQANVLKQAEFVHVVEEYSLRNLTLTEHQDIDRKFGGMDAHQEEKRIIVPVSDRLQ